MSDSKTPRTDSTEEQDMPMLAEQLETELNEAKSELNFALDLFESRRSFGLITDPEVRFLQAHGRVK